MKKIVVLGLFVLSLGMVGCGCDLLDTRCDKENLQVCDNDNNWITAENCTDLGQTCKEDCAGGFACCQ